MGYLPSYDTHLCEYRTSTPTMKARSTSIPNLTRQRRDNRRHIYIGWLRQKIVVLMSFYNNRSARPSVPGLLASPSSPVPF